MANEFKVKSGLKVGGVITSSVTTGAAPLTVLSVTKVTNLNVDQLDGYDADTGTTLNTIPVRDANGKLPGDITGSAPTLTTARTIAISGDITGTATSFDGSANISIPAYLPNIVSSGTSTKITYNAKGLVTAGAALAATDIPSLDAAKITTGTFDDARFPTTTTALGTSTTVTADSVPVSSCYGCFFDVIAYNGTTDRLICTINVLHNGTTTYDSTPFGLMDIGTADADITFTSRIDTGNVELRAQNTSATKSYTLKIKKRFM
jgi:hypothetical protein